MSKVSLSRDWLTLSEAARVLSSELGEEVTESDLLRLSIEKKLEMSVFLVNHAHARLGKIISTNDVDFSKVESPLFSVKDIDDYSLLPSDDYIYIGNESWIFLGVEVNTISGLWQLSNLGAESLDLEDAFQAIIGGPEITLSCLDGVLLQQGDQYAQLQKWNRELDGELVSDAIGKSGQGQHGIESGLLTSANGHLESVEAVEDPRPLPMNYTSSGRLFDHDYHFAIRTEVIQAYVDSLKGIDKQKSDVSPIKDTSFFKLIGALMNNQGIDPTAPGISGFLEELCKLNGHSLSDDTIRKICKKAQPYTSFRNN
ncbi:hypothetical protein [Thalassotalea sp. PS06]|uniref:hypothetical protein n=1 Tax=Thalassotalea sp. PS06 TaxID=2594005 RepID=UPI0011627395|nr:hypothetical protein [Thalassotalea sp. PS06]QDP01568.1 hypothetical protein FNC98_09605 [Thalassotalea sp. PS06]